jgi:hypothetical protein
MSPEMEQQLANLLDREAIRELPRLYCHYVRTRALHPMLELFADDGGFEMPSPGTPGSMAGGVWTGREALAAVFQAGFVRSDPYPFVHNHIVTLLGPDTASGFVYAEVRMGSQNMRAALVVVYEDAYVKERGRWKFRFRKLNLTPIPG